MGGSSSQPHTEKPMSPTRAFPTGDMSSPGYSDTFQQTDSFQHTARDDSPVEVAAPPPKWKSKPTRGRQKRTSQNEDAHRQTALTNEEEIALCKGWVHVSENSKKGNARKNESGAGVEYYFNMALLDYEAKHRMQFTLRHCWAVLKYCPKWMDTEVPSLQFTLEALDSNPTSKTKPPLVILNVANLMISSRCGSSNPCVILDKKKLSLHRTFRSSSFNRKSGDASINLNVDVGDDKEDEVQELRRPMGRDKAKGLKKKRARSSGSSSSTNDEALARLMFSELAMHNQRAIRMKKEECLAFLEIKRMEVECRERELKMQEISNYNASSCGLVRFVDIQAFFGVAGANNDLTVLNNFLFFNNILDDIALVPLFEVNGVTFDRFYNLAIGFTHGGQVSSIHLRLHGTRKMPFFKRRQEGARKDVERAFGVLQGR
ncbi:zinc finger BED domain-containing protein RICESLEEPER 2-like protein [Tanacetum coccineum]